MQASLVFFKALLFENDLDLFLLSQLAFTFQHLHLTAAHLGLTLLEAALNKLTEVDSALLDLLQGLPQFLLLLQLFLQVYELTLQLPLLLVKVVLVLSLLGLQLGLMMHLHFKLLTGKSLLMRFNSFLFLLDQEVNSDLLGSLNGFQVVLVFVPQILKLPLMLSLKLSKPHALLSYLLLHALNFFAFLLLEESFFLWDELLTWDERHERCLACKGETPCKAAT